MSVWQNQSTEEVMVLDILAEDQLESLVSVYITHQQFLLLKFAIKLYHVMMSKPMFKNAE